MRFACRLAFAQSQSFWLRSRSALRCRTLGQSWPQLAGLVSLMGKASVSNITVPPQSSSLSQKPLPWPVCWLWLAHSQSFLLPPPSSVCLHHYCYRSWHLPASPSTPIIGSPRLCPAVLLHSLLYVSMNCFPTYLGY